MVLAFNGKRYETFYGVNIKPFEDGPKVCAEQAAIVSALANGYNTIVAIVVAGVPQNEPDAKSGVKTETLHPCYICRRILRGLPGISDETAIITIHNHKGNVEEQTFGELLKLHSEWS